MTVPFSQTLIQAQPQLHVHQEASRPAAADCSSSSCEQPFFISAQQQQSQQLQQQQYNNYLATFAIPALDEPCDYYIPEAWNNNNNNTSTLTMQQQCHATTATTTAALGHHFEGRSYSSIEPQLNLYNPEFEDAFASSSSQAAAAPNNNSCCSAHNKNNKNNKSIYTSTTPLVDTVEHDDDQEEAYEEQQHYYEAVDQNSASSPPRSPPSFTRPKKKKKKKMKLQRKQQLLLLQHKQKNNNTPSSSSSSPMHIDSSEEENQHASAVSCNQQQQSTPNTTSTVFSVNNQCKLFISHLVRSSDKEKTELVPITRGSLYLSTPHVHKLVLQVQHEADQPVSVAAAHKLPNIALILYRRVFRGETVNGKKDMVLELEGGKKWRPVNFAQGLKGDPIKNAIAVRKAYKPQLINTLPRSKSTNVQPQDYDASKVIQVYEYHFDIQFLVNSFNTSRELEYANFIIQVRKSYDKEDEDNSQSGEEVIFNSEPFRLRARNDYIESKKRRLVMEGDEEDKAR